MKKFGSVIYYVILYNAIITFVSPKLQNFWMALFLVFAAKSFKKPKKYITINNISTVLCRVSKANISRKVASINI